ncbi:hypothetical protein ACVIHD_006143 [Bradyrhizobium embrapense]
MTKRTTATTRMQSGARVTDCTATADRNSPLGDAGFALRVIATAVLMKLHERYLLDEGGAHQSVDPRNWNCAPVND